MLPLPSVLGGGRTTGRPRWGCVGRASPMAMGAPPHGAAAGCLEQLGHVFTRDGCRGQGAQLTALAQKGLREKRSRCGPRSLTR